MTGKISELELVVAFTGDEFIEIIQRGLDGNLVNKRISITKLRSNEGKSAYEVALANGFQGTEAQWLDSMKGKDAYAIAVELGFVGTRSQWIASIKGAAGANGKTVYDIAVDNGFVGNEAAFLLTLKGAKGDKGDKGDIGEAGAKGEDGVIGVDGKTAYESAVDGGFIGTEAEFNLSLAAPKGISGGVFITDITPKNVSDNVGDRVRSADGFSLKTCSATSHDVVVAITAITGHTNYRPVVKLNNVVIPVVAKGDAPLWTGTLDVTLPVADAQGKVVVTVEHEDGAKATTTVQFDTPAQITSAIFTGNYPAGQTELKAGDLFNIRLNTDVPVVGYEIADAGAFEAKSGTFTAGTLQNISGLVVADRGITTTAQSFQVRVKKASGSWSGWYDSITGGVVDKVNTVKLNNLFPTITFGAINYPANQAGLKGVEAATVNHTVTNFDSIAYASTELAIASPSAYAPAKGVTRSGGTYNVSTNNFNITATRAANGAVKTGGVNVAIANVVPVISVSVPGARLRSGGNAGTVAQEYTVTLTSTQALQVAPTLNAPGGTWVEAAFTGNAAKTVWTRKLRVHDDDVKGTYSWNSLVVKSLGGQAVAGISTGTDYVIGGFVFRTMQIAAYLNREGVIGTKVTDVTKLRCSNLSKGSSGSLNTTYKADIASAVDRFTITGPTGVANAGGSLWYNCDTPNASSNTQGGMFIEIEELV